VNVLLLNSNITRCAEVGYGLTPAPAGLIYLAGVLRDHGHAVSIRQVHDHVLDQDEEGLPLVRRELESILADSSPDLIGISVRNVGAQRKPRNPFHLVEYYSVFYDARIVRALRELSRAPIVMGGSAYSVEPGLYVKYARPDYGVVGEGEETLLALVTALEGGRTPEGIPGLVKAYDDIEPACQTAGRLVCTSNIGIGACEVVADFDGEYYRNGGFATVQTKRGCAMNCTYCTTPFFHGHPYRYRPMQQVIDEMKAYIEHWNARHFFFVDGTFNHPIEHALELCNAIVEAGLDIEWYSELTPAAFNDELCRMMVKSGCMGISLTPDSCSESVLKSYTKGFGMAEVRNAVALLKKYGIPFQTHLIVGGPGETKETFAESIEFCSEHLADDPISFYDRMVIVRRAPLFERAAAEGLVDASERLEDLILQNDFRGAKGYEYFFPHLPESRRDLLAMLEEACTGRSWLVPSRDYELDPETREHRLRSHFSAAKGARPWWRGLEKRDTVGDPM
jgi:radical SAM superfamily enzyme YgiQ (UPF0313 family)